MVARRRFLVSGLGVSIGLTLLCGLGASSASAAAPALEAFKAQANPLERPELGASWVGYKATYPLRDVDTKLVRGERSTTGSGGCNFDYSNEATDATPTQELRERAFNETECLTLIEFGRLPEAEERNARAADPIDGDPLAMEGDAGYTEDAPSETDGYTADPAGEPVGVPNAAVDTDPIDSCDLCGTEANAAAGGVRQASGYYHAWLQDPPGVKVTELTTYLTWRWNPRGGCASGRQSRASDDWFEQSGWSKVSSNTRGGTDCAHAWTSTYAQYKNGLFCYVAAAPYGSTTRSIYDRQVIGGYANAVGSLVGRVRNPEKGGCTALLSFRTRLVRTSGGCGIAKCSTGARPEDGGTEPGP